MAGDDNRAVAFAETRAAIHQHVLVGDEGVGEKADGRDVVDFFLGGLVQRFDIGEHMREFYAGQAHLAGSERIKHESVVAVWRVRQLDFRRFW